MSPEGRGHVEIGETHHLKISCHVNPSYSPRVTLESVFHEKHVFRVSFVVGRLETSHEPLIPQPVTINNEHTTACRRMTMRKRVLFTSHHWSQNVPIWLTSKLVTTKQIKKRFFFVKN